MHDIAGFKIERQRKTPNATDDRAVIRVGKQALLSYSVVWVATMTF